MLAHANTNVNGSDENIEEMEKKELLLSKSVTEVNRNATTLTRESELKKSESLSKQQFETPRRLTKSAEDQDNENRKSKTILIIPKKKYFRKHANCRESISFRELPPQKNANYTQTDDEYHAFKSKLKELETEVKELKEHIGDLREVKENLLSNIKTYQQSNKTLSEYFELTCRERDSFHKKLREIELACYDKPNRCLVKLITAILNEEEFCDDKNKESCTVM
ncbi:Hypothetical predicted protein [Octopus vulgaris]|uniref:Uncharacterized protein n=1 Tax=Octopus vulgaris TaxID=6645 RepID=A0AA36BJ02_OCTVU|nr:Hypothetical predicted protein [Octopus vulgaris]